MTQIECSLSCIDQNERNNSSTFTIFKVVIDSYEPLCIIVPWHINQAQFVTLRDLDGFVCLWNFNNELSNKQLLIIRLLFNRLNSKL